MFEILTIIAVIQVTGLIILRFLHHQETSKIDTEKYYWKRKYHNLKEKGIDSYMFGDEEYK